MNRFANDEASRAFVATLTDAFNTLRDHSKTAQSAQESLTSTVRALDSVFAAMPLPFDDALRTKAAAAHKAQIALLTAIADNTGVSAALEAQKRAQQAFTFAAERATRADTDAQRNGAEVTFFIDAMFGASPTVRKDIALAAAEGNLEALFEYTSQLYAPTEDEPAIDVPAAPNVVTPLLDVENVADKPSSAGEKAVRDAVMRQMVRVPNLRAQDLTGSVVAAAARIREHPDFVLSEANLRIGSAVVPFTQQSLSGVPGELYTLAMTRVVNWLNPFAWYRQYVWQVDYYNARVSELERRRKDIEKIKVFAQKIGEINAQLDEDIREAGWDVGYLAPRRPDHHLRGVHTAGETKLALDAKLRDASDPKKTLEMRQGEVIEKYLKQIKREERNLKLRIKVLRDGGGSLKDDDAADAAIAEWQERTYETDQQALERIKRMFPGAVLSFNDAGELVAVPRFGYVSTTETTRGLLTDKSSDDDNSSNAGAEQLASVRVPLDQAIDGNTDLWKQGFRGTLSPSTVQLFFESAGFTSADLVARFPLLVSYVNSVGRLNRASKLGFGDSEGAEDIRRFDSIVDEALREKELSSMGNLVLSLKEYAFARLPGDSKYMAATELGNVLSEVPPPEDRTHKDVLAVIQEISRQFRVNALQNAFRLGHTLSILETRDARSLPNAIAIEVAPGRQLSPQERMQVEQTLQERALAVLQGVQEQSLRLVEAPVAEANKAIGYSHSIVGPTTIEVVQRAPGSLFGFPASSLIEIELHSPTAEESSPSRDALYRIIERSPLRQIRTLTRIETVNGGPRPSLVVDEIVRNVLPEEIRRIQIANLQTNKVVTIRVSNDTTTEPYIVERSFPANITADAEPNGALLMSRLQTAMLGTMAGRTFVQSVTALLTEARQPQGTFLRDDEQTFVELLRSYTINPLQNVGELLVSMARSRDSSHESLLALSVVSSGISYLISLFGVVRICIWPLIALVDRLTGVVTAAMRLMLQAALATVHVVSTNTQWALVTSLLNTFEQASRRHPRGGAVKRKIDLLRRFANTMQAEQKSPLDVATDPNATFLGHLQRFANEYGLASIGARSAYTTLFAALTEAFKTHRWLQSAVAVGMLAAVMADIYATGALLGAINILAGLLLNVTRGAWAQPQAFFLTFAYGAMARYSTRLVVNAVAAQISQLVSKLGGGDAYDPKSIAAAVRRGIVVSGVLLGNLAPYVVGSEYTVLPSDAGILASVDANIRNLVRDVFTKGVSMKVERITPELASQLLPVYTGRLLGRLSIDLAWYMFAQQEFGGYVAPSVAAEQQLMADVHNAFSPSYLRQTGTAIAAEGKELWRRIIERLINYDSEKDEAGLLEQRRGTLLPQTSALATNFLLLLTSGDLSRALQESAKFGRVIGVTADLTVTVRAPTAQLASDLATQRYAEVVRNIPTLRDSVDNEEATTEQIVETKEFEGERRFSIETVDDPSPTQLAEFGPRQLDPLLALSDVRFIDVRVKFAHKKELLDPYSSLLNGTFAWLGTSSAKYLELLRGVDVDDLVQELFVTLAVGERLPLVSTAK